VRRSLWQTFGDSTRGFLTLCVLLMYRRYAMSPASVSKSWSRGSMYLRNSWCFAYIQFVRFEAFTAATMKNGVFWDVTSCGVRRLLVTANVPSSPILVTVMMEAQSSSETSTLTRATRRNIAEDAVLHPVCSTTQELLTFPRFRSVISTLSNEGQFT
jgi:hypothetical protein